MGVSIAATAINSGHDVFWVSEGRSEKTRERAKKYGLTSVPSLSELCSICEIILCVCPPHAAQDVALAVIHASFKGLYLDANAIAPKHSMIIGQLVEAAGIRFVDGGIIGGPAWTPNETWLYLSGDHAESIAACFLNGPLGSSRIAWRSE
jgi:3-hydroxyisobutyrate dehydrogenase-like beta-hydroxyacid dehydrogenase